MICGECCAALAPDPRVLALEQENARLREQLTTLFYLHSANSTASPR